MQNTEYINNNDLGELFVLGENCTKNELDAYIEETPNVYRFQKTDIKEPHLYRINKILWNYKPNSLEIVE